MKETEITKVRDLLRVKDKGPLRNLFYKNNGLPRHGLHTKRQILEKLGVNDFEINTLEQDGVNRLLGQALAALRKQAKDSDMPWMDVEIIGKGARVARHGYSNDIPLMDLNVEKFEKMASERKAIAKKTREIATRQKHLIESAA